MGCFARTCGLTNTGILEDDKILFIELNHLKPQPFYNIIQSLQFYIRTIKERDEFNENFKEVISKDKTIKFPELTGPIGNVYVGTYNDYGSIKEHETLEVEYEEIEHIPLHYWAVEWLMGEVRTDLDFIEKLFYKLYSLRKSPLDTILLGRQHTDIDECIEQHKMNVEINKFLTKRIKQIKKWTQD